MKAVIRLVTLLGLFSMLAGCITVNSPDSQYVLTKEGFQKVEASPASATTAEAQPTAASTLDTTTTSTQSKTSDAWTPNKEGAWGFCCRQGRGTEPEPMAAFEFSYPVDVDVAYLKLKQEFNFLSRDDLARKPIVQGYLDEKHLFHLRYEATPGVHYKMRNFVKHPFGNEESSNTIEVELFKAGTDRVKIRVMYYAGNTKDTKGYEASLKQRIERTIRNG